MGPEWSPAGTKLLAYSLLGEDTGGFFVMNANGTDLVNFNTEPGSEEYINLRANHTWSPDGGRVAFQRRSAGNLEIVVATADGGSVLDVTNCPGEDLFLDWSPDGTRILLASDRNGAFELYIVNADGSGLVRLTDSLRSEDGREAI